MRRRSVNKVALLITIFAIAVAKEVTYCVVIDAPVLFTLLAGKRSID